MTERQFNLEYGPVSARRLRESWEKSCLIILGQDLYNKTRNMPESWTGVIKDTEVTE